jgi:predicted deacylase
MRFLVNMMNNQDTDPRITRMIEEHELFFIPVVNPDGFTKRRRYTADGTDPNREYPYPNKPNKESVQCIKKEIEFFHSRKFAGSMDLHAHGELIMYPWGYTKDTVPAADKDMFETLGKAMGKDNGYKVGQISRIIYVAQASSADYYYWKNGTIAFGIELGRSKVPRSRKIEGIVKDTTSMIYTFIEKF